ncbi:hypothetical protein AAY24_05060 [Sedimenticola thiotaurini]|uniref:Ferredoxin-type protein NapF n=1 Tax=Sedimenticola thiotaurini TaxID=1543721 RepID=A0A0F7K0P3_9GAMM|nr:hypothetical protein AAY24_05060 [Sedimenticola thiotaurini]
MPNSGSSPFRPPWSVPEIDFIDLCDGCGHCITACPDKLIVVGRGKLPRMDFSRGGCDFCMACVSACKTGALVEAVQSDQLPWKIKALIQPGCLSLQAVICRSCGEVCDERAIRFTPEPGGVARPSLSTDSCTGCGACFSVCPIQAVTLSSTNEPRNQAA